MTPPFSADRAVWFPGRFRPRRFSRAIAAIVFAIGLGALATACGGEPDGGLLEVHASLEPVLSALEPSVGEQVRDYRVYRVLVQGGGTDEIREVERRGDPPDVFVVRTNVTTPLSSEDAFSIAVRVRLVRFTLNGEEILGCQEQGDVVVIDGAVNVLDVELQPGECP